MLFVPSYRRLLLWLNGLRTPAALLTLLIALVIVILPFAMVTVSAAREAAWVCERIHSGEWLPVALYFFVTGALW